MQFRIADTFLSSLAKLNRDEQKVVKTTVFDLQSSPANPGIRLHKIHSRHDPNFWSVSASLDLRLIVHRQPDSMLLCYVDHHDQAYRWAERRKIESHPKTGAAQLIEVRQTVREIKQPPLRTADDERAPDLTETYVKAAQPESAQVKRSRPVLAHVADAELLGYGVPLEWISALRDADEDQLLDIALRLPAEAEEAVLELAVGRQPPRPAVAPAAANSFEHPDAQRRFRLIQDREELERALEYPWDKWAVFLHPEQRVIVEKDYGGPARIGGSAGTGKTIVALHRAVHLARSNPGARVLLTTFSDTLATALKARLQRLIGNEPRRGEQLEVRAIDAIGERLYRARVGRPVIATRERVQELLDRTAGGVEEQQFRPQFLLEEWEDVVDAWQLQTWEAYRDVKRLGRKTRLPEAQRRVLWEIFEQVKDGLRDEGLTTRAEMFRALAEGMQAGGNPPFDFAVVDEAQDLGVAQLRFLAALGGGRPEALFFVGDLGQRIFQIPFSWKALGVDVQGRSETLRFNYRMSRQIGEQANRLLEPELADVDGNVEDRRGIRSAFDGPEPQVRVLDSAGKEAEIVGAWLATCAEQGVPIGEMAVVVRSEGQLERAREAARRAGMVAGALDEGQLTPPATGTDDRLAVGTMHLAKGLEFRAVAVMACDDDVLPLQERITSVADDADLTEVYSTERHLLYVACTRARDHLLVTSTDPASEFLDDLGA